MSIDVHRNSVFCQLWKNFESRVQIILALWLRNAIYCVLTMGWTQYTMKYSVITIWFVCLRESATYLQYYIHVSTEQIKANNKHTRIYDKLQAKVPLRK